MTTSERIVRINAVNKGFCTNEIYVSKYTVVTFLPKFLFEQFRRYDNLFFATLSCIQLIPHISPVGKFNTLVPLTCILVVSAIKEIVEDVKRHREDDKVNFSKVWVLVNKKWMRICWKDITVGALVKMTKYLPTMAADMVLLASSDDSNICYLETSNLDGESNLKIKQAMSLDIHTNSPVVLSEFKGEMYMELPNPNIYQFVGTILQEGKQMMVGEEQFLPRGTCLQNTDWIVAIVVYTGRETKLAKNAHDAPLKQSTVDKINNRYIIFLCFVLLILSAIITLCCVLFTLNYLQDVSYLGNWVHEFKSGLKIFLQFLTSVILLNTIIPISLPVQLQVVRVIQSLLMESDLNMYDEKMDKTMFAKTSNLNEELGMVNYIFSDKTGTLTQNCMLFKSCSIAGHEYGLEKGQSCLENVYLQRECRDYESPAKNFFRALALCHSVIAMEDKNEGKIVYQAASPDEAALVSAAQSLGMVFYKRNLDTITLLENGIEMVYTRLHVIEFDSTRKRMSVIIRLPDGTIKLLVKGADNVIMERLSVHSVFRKATLEHLDKFANIGFRTLCVAERILDEKTLAEIEKIFEKATSDIPNRSHHLQYAGTFAERNLKLLGATAIEDKLQDKVPETIASLMVANISVWMLTGDKLETALSIGHSTKLIQPHMVVYIIKDESITEVELKLVDILNHGRLESHQCVLLLSGLGLTCCLKEDLKAMFLEVALKCKTVICSRASPKQKADVVELIRTELPDSVTLAVGDGANDVGMIQAAHVGIGIYGMEGSQAARSSDYAISQFRFLKRLLLVHGSWNYHRLTKMMLYSYYKNILLYVIAFWYSLYCGFSGTMFFERWSTSLYNLIFSSLCPFVIGIFERSRPARECMRNPKYYLETQSGKLFDFSTFLCWIASGLWQSIIIFFSCYLMMSHDIVFSDGKTSNIYLFGNVTYTVVLITIYLKMALHQISWSLCIHLSLYLSFLLWILYLIIMSYIFQILPVGYEMIGMAQNLFEAPVFYICILVVPGLAMFIDVTTKMFTDNFVRSGMDFINTHFGKKQSGVSSKKEIIPEDSSIEFNNLDVPATNEVVEQGSIEIIF